MRIAVAAKKRNDTYVVEPVFGRADLFVLVEKGKDAREVHENPYRDDTEAVGKKVAQWLIKEGVTTVLCGDVGSKTRFYLSEGGIFSAIGYDGTVDEALARYFAS
ncbi:NifB/NifX family molybdenum-iron cluster-binding protein [Halodesulfovibrio sp.]|jgi:predicted Fe-Mo cluster-binding NifX family protein|uniref:NifB/NifX family molybdenum-iron cluster-binding protein n=1 Tax=Halodesulfovibrio sp. TaxID=1912772 RepID=UPI0025DB8E1D|nr:NifB/NifX family molybdenum-iron cluster-binding protein [Halodesulfovibrio sp.]MCT4534465.1 dinitrogenase iron-molybdenum cofactor biosynthesis protein [Halodesulfovibrio sp.]MCT4625964.1 dinitrogenase iron-molybdenum cofactor biosynthesis protein [Halodesulfovibrio sp.]